LVFVSSDDENYARKNTRVYLSYEPAARNPVYYYVNHINITYSAAAALAID
jgi:hypothetical protein